MGLQFDFSRRCTERAGPKDFGISVLEVMHADVAEMVVR